MSSGKELLVKLDLSCNVNGASEKIPSEEIDHHLLLKEEDLTCQLMDVCGRLKVRRVCL